MFLNSTDDVRYDINFASSDRAYDNLTSWTNRLVGALDMVCPRPLEARGKVGSTQYGSALVSGRTWPVTGDEKFDVVSIEFKFCQRHRRSTSDVDEPLEKEEGGGRSGAQMELTR